MSLFSKFQRPKNKLVTKALSGDQVTAIFDTSSFSDVTMTATNVLNIWPYVSNIPHSDYAGYSLTKNEEVETVRRTFENTFDLVHVTTDIPDLKLPILTHRSVKRTSIKFSLPPRIKNAKTSVSRGNF